MAILRESSALGPVRGAQVAQVSTGAGVRTKQPNFRKFASEPSTSDLIIDSVIPAAQKVASGAWEAQKEDAYIAGVAHASKKGSEQELEASPFMKDWTTAGFRDTEGRNAMTKFQTEQVEAYKAAIATDDPQGHFSQWLSGATSKISNQFNGMSRQARAGLFAQLAVEVDKAQTGFTKEYTKHVIATEEASLQAGFTAARISLDDNKDDPAAYAAASRSFVAGVYTNIWLNEKLPTENRIALTKEAIEYAASTGNVQVYEELKRVKFSFPDGSEGTVMQKLPMSDQVELDKTQRDAMGRAKGIRSASFFDSINRMQVEWEDPNGAGPTISPTQLEADLQVGLNEGFITGSKYGEIKKSYYKAQARNGVDNNLALLWNNGDREAIRRAGYTEEDGARASRKMAQSQPLEQRVQSVLNTALSSGMTSAYSELGTILNPTISLLGFDENLRESDAQLAHQVVQAMDQAEKTNPGAYSRMLTSLTDENKDFMLHMREVAKSGVADPAAAIAKARADIIKYDISGPLGKAMVTEARKENVKAAQEVADLGITDYAWAFFGDKTSAGKVVGGARERFFESEELVQRARANFQMAVSAELEARVTTQLGLPAKARLDSAVSAVAARTIPGADSPLIIPRGQTPQTFFKPSDGSSMEFADSEYIGKALDFLEQAPEGGRVVWDTNPAGDRISFEVFNKQGERIRTGTHRPAAVGDIVQENLEADGDKANTYIGAGKVQKSNEAQVRYNGTNTAGLAPKAMIDLRDEIVKWEGVRKAQYPDGQKVAGNVSYGVGISRTNKLRFEEPAGQDGQYTQDQIDNSFSLASNDAAEEASRIQSRTGLEGDDWALFFGELAYQSPKSARNSEMLAYIQVGDVDNAVAALKKTPAFQVKGAEDRNAARIQRLRKAMQQ